MREIFCRGKRVDNGEWVYSSFIMQDKEHKLLSAKVKLFDGEKWRAVIPETVGQFTGLTDKNGKKIFEGDIIECNAFGTMATDKHKKYLVVFDNGTYFAQWSIGERRFSVYMNETWERNVVGNKWDNPELLEVKK